jgi:hypothetical protein
VRAAEHTSLPLSSGLLMPNDAATLNVFGCSSTRTCPESNGVTRAVNCTKCFSNAFGRNVCVHGRRQNSCRECANGMPLARDKKCPICDKLERHCKARGCNPKGEEPMPATAPTATAESATKVGSGRKPVAKCEHGRLKPQCKDSGGSGICSHGRRKTSCRECKGVAICSHRRLRVHCKECKGKAICSHGRRQRVCKECGGSAICPHGRDRYTCKECKGGGICLHGRHRRVCKECKGSAICPHGRRETGCKECKSLKLAEFDREAAELARAAGNRS